MEGPKLSGIEEVRGMAEYQYRLSSLPRLQHELGWAGSQ